MEAEVIHAFLKAETDPAADRWSKYYGLDAASRARLVDHPDLLSEGENAERLKLLLSVRAPLYDRFIRGKTWTLVDADIQELENMMYPSTDWLHLTPSLRVGHGARVFAVMPRTNASARFSSDRDRCHTIAKLYASQVELVEPIAVSCDNVFVIIEGCARVTAYLMSGAKSALRMFVGEPRRLQPLDTV